MGGSQGAESINQLMIDTAPRLAAKLPTLQFLHLTGPNDMERVRRAYAAGQQKAVVQPFLTEMELALGAATVAVSRAGASSLAELAAMQLPTILIPYPSAADDHQFYNARAFAEAGAARMVGQKNVTPEILAELVTGLVSHEKEREHIRAVLRQRHVPDAAARIAERILNVIHERDTVAGKGIGSVAKPDRAGRYRVERTTESEFAAVHVIRTTLGGYLEFKIVVKVTTTENVNAILQNPGAIVYLVGAGGCGMSGLGHLLIDLGHRVVGSDLVVNEETRQLRARGAEIQPAHAAEQLHAARPHWSSHFGGIARAASRGKIADPNRAPCGLLAALQNRQPAFAWQACMAKRPPQRSRFALDQLG
jgi:UDP-N-acetylglucosamine transferase subunit ALG13